MTMKSPEANPELKPSHVRSKRVSVVKHQVHPEMWNDLAAVTRDRILLMDPRADGWCVYLNPEFTVEGPEFSSEFSREARSCQRSWIKTMNDTLKNKYRRQSARTFEYLERQLFHNGVLMINGNMVPPHEWKSLEVEIEFQSAQKNRGETSHSRGVNQ